MSRVKYGLYVKTTKRNYKIEFILSLIYMAIVSLSILTYSYKTLFMVPISTLFFFRFVEYKLTGIHIQFLFVHETGNLAKALAYISLLTSIFWIALFLLFGYST